jgi:hypothetical protein
MRHKPLALTVSVLALASLTLATPAFAARPVAYSNKVKVVGNNVTIKTSGGVTVVQSSNSCSQGISGYLYQSIVVIFGGGTVVSTQSAYCP